MVRIIGVSGSLRRESYNSAVLRAAAALMPPDSKLEIATIAGIPLYNADDEVAHGVPVAVSQLKDAIAAADGLLLVTPEYNNSIPGVAKNAVDWLSRPSSDIGRVFRGRPVAMTGASNGSFGTTLAQTAWLAVWRTLGVDFWAGGRLLVTNAAKLIGADGEIADAATREAIQKFMGGFVAHIRSRLQPEPGVR